MGRGLPSYRRHKASGQAVVTFPGQPDVYLGAFNSKASRAEYDRRLAEWLAAGRRSPTADADLTVDEVLLRYLDYAESYYRRSDGKPASEVLNIKRALAPLSKLYGPTLAAEFGPVKLRVVREQLIDAGRTRKRINYFVNIIRRAFKWGVANELIPSSVSHALEALDGLRAGRSNAKEGKHIKPVAIAHVDAIREYVTPQVWAIVQLQRFTGCRSGEALQMRTGDIDRTGEVWKYRPRSHKTEHHGKERVIYLSPAAQAMLKPWLKADPDAFLFSPKEAMDAARQRKKANRKTPLSCGNKPGSNRKRKPKKLPGDCYTTGSYGQAVRFGCRKATEANVKRFMAERGLTETPDPIPLELIVPHWHPHQIRHTVATEIRRQHGLEAAQLIMGHSQANVTQIYAERDDAKAVAIMAQAG